MIDFIVLLGLLITDEPNRAIDNSAIQIFIESQRTASNGPGRILATARGYYDVDSFPDRLVIYTYEHGLNRGDRVHGMFAVAFLTESFETTDILFIPEVEMVPDRLLKYSSRGNELVITGEKHLPGDAMCCPSAIASITFSVADGKVVILKGEYRRHSTRD